MSRKSGLRVGKVRSSAITVSTCPRFNFLISFLPNSYASCHRRKTICLRHPKGVPARAKCRLSGSRTSHLEITLPYQVFRTTPPIPLVVIHSLALLGCFVNSRANVRGYTPPPPAVNMGTVCRVQRFVVQSLHLTSGAIVATVPYFTNR